MTSFVGIITSTSIGFRLEGTFEGYSSYDQGRVQEFLKGGGGGGALILVFKVGVRPPKPPLALTPGQFHFFASLLTNVGGVHIFQNLYDIMMH